MAATTEAPKVNFCATFEREKKHVCSPTRGPTDVDCGGFVDGGNTRWCAWWWVLVHAFEVCFAHFLFSSSLFLSGKSSKAPPEKKKFHFESTRFEKKWKKGCLYSRALEVGLEFLQSVFNGHNSPVILWERHVCVYVLSRSSWGEVDQQKQLSFLATSIKKRISRWVLWNHIQIACYCSITSRESQLLLVCTFGTRTLKAQNHNLQPSFVIHSPF